MLLKPVSQRQKFTALTVNASKTRSYIILYTGYLHTSPKTHNSLYYTIAHKVSGWSLLVTVHCLDELFQNINSSSVFMNLTQGYQGLATLGWEPIVKKNLFTRHQTSDERRLIPEIAPWKAILDVHLLHFTMLYHFWLQLITLPLASTVPILLPSLRLPLHWSAVTPPQPRAKGANICLDHTFFSKQIRADSQGFFGNIFLRILDWWEKISERIYSSFGMWRT